MQNVSGKFGVPVEIPLVEGSPCDIRVTQDALWDGNGAIPRHVASEGGAALASLKCEGTHLAAPRPVFSVLDLNLPKMDGGDVLAHIKVDDNLKTIPIVILSTSEAEGRFCEELSLRANGYLSKPVEFDAFESVEEHQ